MKLIVHRGSRQIGGSCIELSSGTTRIILDAGLPLDADVTSGSLHPPVAGLFGSEGPSVDALFLSHAHADHSGLISSARADVPVYLTEGTSKMMMAGGIFAGQPRLGSRTVTIVAHGSPVSVGPFTITAWPVDHSVYDSSAFIVEAGGKRLLYTGDLRFHGRKPGMAQQLVRAAALAPIDALVIEGTRLGVRASEDNLSEKQLEAQLVNDFRSAPGIVLAMYSPLNLDRFVTYYRAAIRSGRTFVIDPYQAFTLHLINRRTLPKPGSQHLWTMHPPDYQSTGPGRRLAGKKAMTVVRRGLISRDEVLAAPQKFVVLFRPSMQPWFCPEGLPAKATAIFSYWPGYLRERRMKKLQMDLERCGGVLLPRHASGHGHPDNLRSFVEKIGPKVLIPVHTNEPEAWAKLWRDTRVARDGVPVPI